MEIEFIQKIFLNGDNELLLIIAGKGKPEYQYIYREAAGVYWDNAQNAFKSTPIKDKTISEWFFHIEDIVKNCLKVDLRLKDKIEWNEIPVSEKIKIENEYHRRTS